MKLFFLIAVHTLAAVAILLISDFGLAGVGLKLFLILSVALSFKRHLSRHKQKITLGLKADNLTDLTIGDRDYHDLQLCHQSYASDMLVQLVLLDTLSGQRYPITLFPDAMDAATHSQLRARFKLASNQGLSASA
ncbi:MAG: hypothetical protein PF589_05250 [Gammaproteobacteria bacterium]|nr:hypothetical protein [Gammaproteobacteria bacterium]